MRKKLFIGNWKMHGSIDSIRLLLDTLCQAIPKTIEAEVVVIPPAIYIPLVATLLQGKNIQWGSQNVYPAAQGAFTGEISAPMLKDYHCRYVLVGHSERRKLFFEDEKLIAEKFHHVKEHGMTPILCVGETGKERDEGRTQEILTRQLQSVAKNHAQAFSNCVIAYGPVWAIGGEQTALPIQIQEVHSAIRALITEFGEEKGLNVPLLYGGSITDLNAKALFAMPDVDGGFIGGASLNAQKFAEIMESINSY
jgi:triosephosphate isomerase